MINLSLRTRLTIWFAASLSLILAPFLAGVLALEWQSMRGSLDHHLNEDAETAAEMLVLRAGQFAWRVDSETDPGYDAGPRRWVEVYRQDGELLFARGIPVRDDIRHALPQPASQPIGYRTLHTPAGAAVRVLTQRHTIDGSPVILRVARSEDALRDALRFLALIFALGTPLAILGAAVAGYIISGRALLPLVRMAARARTISADDLAQRLPVENPNDEMGQLAVVFNDTFDRLHASFERLKRFTADASHQLRTPLTAIRSVGEVGLRGSKTVEDYQEVVGSMLEEVDRLARLVDTLLTLSRWESGRVPCVPQAIDLGAIARDVAAQLSVLAEDRGITCETAAATLPAFADPDMIRAAVLNVIDNAIKFTPDGGQVTISGSWEDGRCLLIVDDTGPGIPFEQRDRVLERFHRRESSATSAASRSGSGLGLAIAVWAIRANQGDLRIDENPARGARVIITLPLHH